MIDGITSRPFSAATLPPIKVDPTSGVKDKIIESSRKLFTRSRAEVENEISKWSGMLQVGEGEAKYKADCSNCGKSTMVPFEPQEGRPVYCKDCMFKIKSGELKPETGFVASRSSRQEERVSTAPLASLGIEFPVTDSNFRISKNYNQQPEKAPVSQNNNNGNTNNNKNGYKNNNNSDQNRNHFVRNEKKHNGPSPLLKGLLQKIGINNGKDEVVPEVEAVEIKKEVPAPVSLSSLKKENSKDANKTFTAPVKEASDEHKASLKDLLAKTMNNHHNNIEPKNEESKTEAHIEIKKDVIIEKEETPVLEVKKEEVVVKTPAPAPSPSIPDIVEEAPIQNIPKKPEDVPSSSNNTESSDSLSWQKRTAKKEVPEDVLRKVLE